MPLTRSRSQGRPAARAARPRIETLEGRRLLAVSFANDPLPAGSTAPLGITDGPDGALWFTEGGDRSRDIPGKVGRITTAGAITEFVLPSPPSFPTAIVAGPDGALWFTTAGDDPGTPSMVGRITTAGAITEFPIPSGEDFLGGIAAGPDGALWFTEAGGFVGSFAEEVGVDAIGRITTAGVVTEFPLPHQLKVGASPDHITAGPDGNLWFTEMSNGRFPVNPIAIGRITPAGAIAEFPLPRDASPPAGIVVGPDGALWFAETFGVGQPTGAAGGRVGRITTAGVISEFPTPSGDFPNDITAGPDGALWFTESVSPFLGANLGSDAIGRIMPAGAIAEFPLASSAQTYPDAITTGPDGNLWFTGGTMVDSIGQVVIRPLSAAGLDVAAAAGRPFLGAVASFAPGPGQSASDYAALIGWGDGSPPSVGAVVPAGAGRLDVVGAHTFLRAGPIPVTVAIGLVGGTTATATSIATVAAAVPPAVVGFERLGIHRQPTRLVLAFSAPLDPARAQDPSNYILAAPGPDRIFGTRDDRVIPIVAATYDPAADTVTLAPRRRLDRHRPFQLTVVGTGPRGVAGVDGTLLDGGRTGQPGSDFVVRFGRGAALPASDRLRSPVDTVGVPIPSGNVPSGPARRPRISPLRHTRPSA
jgi:virginiamycin B lyase